MMDNNTRAVDEFDPSQQPTEKQRILGISRVVWEQVVVPWVLRPAVARRKWARELPPSVVSCVLATAEAMFPLVALASRAVAVGPSPTRYRELGHYRDLEHAAAALSPKCVAWIIANNAKNRRERRRQAARVGSLLAIPQSSTGGTTSSTNDNITTRDWDGDGGNVDNNEEMEEEIGWMMRREREWVAVLTGLCCGGHLGMAKMFLGSRWEGGVVWPKEGVVAQQQLTAQCTTLPGGGALLCDEFWSERGMWNLVRRVCAAGHLEVLQWVLTDVLQLNRTELVGEPLLQAALNGHLHIFKWLVSTFDLDGPANSEGVAGSFHPTKGRVSDVKRLVETFPHWDFRLGESVQYLADSAAFCKGCSSDEIIEVCQWLKDRFSLHGVDFISPDNLISLPKSAKVIKWALSDVPDVSEMWSLWDLCCTQAGNVELGKWLVEEKGAIVNSARFFDACSGTHDKVEFVEWLFKKLGDELSSSDLLNALHRALANPNRLDLICKWLEKQILTTTGTKPKISFSKLLYWHQPEGDGWLDWVFTHHSDACDLNWTQSEVLDFSNGEIFVLKNDAAVSIWNRFSLSPVTHHDILLKLVLRFVHHGTSSQIQQVLSLGEFSYSEMEKFLEEYSACADSSKIVKLLVSSLFLSRRLMQKRRIENTPQVIRAIFLKMVSSNKRSCARWLFNKFNITLPQFLSAIECASTLNQVNFATWKLMLDLFPGITRDVVIHNFMAIVVASPLHTQFTMDKLGVTQDDIEQF